MQKGDLQLQVSDWCNEHKYIFGIFCSKVDWKWDSRNDKITLGK